MGYLKIYTIFIKMFKNDDFTQKNCQSLHPRPVQSQ
jgi:hypothetical protein